MAATVGNFVKEGKTVVVVDEVEVVVDGVVKKTLALL